MMRWMPNAATGRANPVWALAIAVLTTAAASAEVYVEARSSSLSQAGPYPVSSHALVQNGILPGGGNNVAGPNGSSSAGPIESNPTTAFANTAQQDGGVLTTSDTQADLGKGDLGVLINAGGGANGVSIGIGIPKWTETITLNNINATSVELDFYWDTDGSVVDNSGPLYGSIDLKSSVELSIVNDVNFKDVHLKGAPAYFLGGCQFIYNGVSGSRFEFAPVGNNDYGSWTTTPVGNFSGTIKATLIVPPGVVSITVKTLLSVDARSGAIVDYVDGARFIFGPRPAGLTWTSESRAFLRSTPAGSADADSDGTPDVSDGCPNDASKTSAGTCGCGVPDADSDGDGACDAVDNCPSVSNADQADADSDGVGDACDNCAQTANPDQADTNSDGTGDACASGGPGTGTPLCGMSCGPMGFGAIAQIALGLAFLRRRQR
ncbi:MAG: thrombospondin type 3 repeat-containing protein [Phycisphaerae bacterium]